MKETKGIVLGITGGVGVGKSEVLSYLTTKPGTVVYDLDTIAHELQEPGKSGYKAILTHFGEEVLIKVHEGNRNALELRPISREALGEIVFHSPEALEVLNGLIHPRVMDKVLELIECHKNEILVIEGALLLEAGYKNLCTEIWNIDADMEVRKQRVITSRGYTIEKFQSIVANQAPCEKLIKVSHRTIDNSKSLEHLHTILDKAYYALDEYRH